MSLALLFHYLMLNMFRTLIYPSSGACDKAHHTKHTPLNTINIH